MKTSLEQNTLLLPPHIAKKIGIKAALVLQQLHYWLQKSKHWIDGAKWIYNTFAEWVNQFPFSERTMKRVIGRLRELKLIKVEQFERHHWDHTNWYTIDYQELKVLISSIVPNCPGQLGQNDPTDEASLAPSSSEISPETSPNKEEIPKVRKKKRSEFDQWYDHAYSEGWVAGRYGESVTLKIGPLAGCMRDWKEVSKNLDYFLSPTEPLKPGQFLRVLYKGFAKK